MDSKKAATTMVVASDSTLPLEIVELTSFSDEADELIGHENLEELRQELSTLRQLGVLVRGTGGLRKFRWGVKGKGKRGGARVLYYYGGDEIPIFLIAVYAKNEKIDMTRPEKKAAKKLIAQLEREYRARRGSPQLRVVSSVRRRR